MMRGNKIGQWHRRGKYLLATLHKGANDGGQINSTNIDGGWLGVHLRMTGQFQWHEKESIPCSHTRVRFWNQTGKELRFVDIRSFGQMWWVPPSIAPEKIITGLKKLGPEPFSKEFNPSYLRQRLKGKTRPIKTALLDQSVVAGAGNIYSDESLFAAGILPKTPSGQLKKIQIERLYTSLIEVLTISIGKGGTTFSDFRDLEGTNGEYGGQAWVYGRGGQPCRKCGTKLLREILSGRSTHWCPKCQK